MPVGRVNDRKPDGHSGHRRLQEVVGSTLRLIGQADWAVAMPRLLRLYPR